MPRTSSVRSIQTDREDSIALELLIKLLYPRGPTQGCVLIKNFEVSTHIKIYLPVHANGGKAAGADPGGWIGWLATPLGCVVSMIFFV